MYCTEIPQQACQRRKKHKARQGAEESFVSAAVKKKKIKNNNTGIKNTQGISNLKKKEVAK